MRTKEFQGPIGIQGLAGIQGILGHQGLELTTHIEGYRNINGVTGYRGTQIRKKAKKICSECGKEMRVGVLSSNRCIYCGYNERGQIVR